MQALVRKYIGFQTFFNLLLWVPIFYEFQKMAGLSDPEIFGIQSVYYVVFCLFEIPTGFIADRFGYRFSMALGSVVLVLANVLPLTNPTYAGFMAHFLAIALGRSLMSGAASAYLYEALRLRGEQAKYKKIEGDARFYSLIARVAAWAAVGYLMTWQAGSPYWISAINAVIALGLVFALPRLAGHPEQGAGSSAGAAPETGLAQTKRAVSSVLGNPRILLLMCQGIGIFVLVRVLQVNLYQPVLKLNEFDVTTFGWIMSLMTVFEAIGSKVAHKVKALLSDLTTVTAMTLILCVCLVAIALLGQAGVLVGFCVFSLASGIAFPVQKQLLNDAIADSRIRATTLSMESILDRAFCSLAVLPLGALVAQGRLSDTLLVTAGATAAAAFFIQFMTVNLSRKGTHERALETPAHAGTASNAGNAGPG